MNQALAVSNRPARGCVWRALLALMLAAGANAAQATHFRGANPSWVETSPGTVEFTLTGAFRRCGYAGTAADGCPAVGDVIEEDIGRTNYNFGDGSHTPTLKFKVIAINVLDDYLLAQALDPDSGRAPIVHSYVGTGPFDAGFASCCTIVQLNNNADNDYSNTTRLRLARAVASPRSSLAPIIDVGSSGVQKIPVPALDPRGRPLRWRLATAAEACAGNCSDPVPPNFTIGARTGIISWDTTGLASGLWYASVVVEALNASNARVASTQLNFLLRISDSSNRRPAFVAPTPAQQAAFTVPAGSSLSIGLKATDPDAGQVVHIDHLGLPRGATLVSSDGRPAQATFQWSPSVCDVGDYLVTFTAQDDLGAGATPRTIRLTVTGQGVKVGEVQLNPAANSQYLPGQQCVQASVFDQGQRPIPTLPIDFQVSGVHPGGARATTDALGMASHCWAGVRKGDDVLTALACSVPAEAQIRWLPRPVRLEVEPVTVELDPKVPGQSKVFLKPVAHLHDGLDGTALPGRSIAFFAGGKALCSAVTNAAGTASCAVAAGTLLDGVTSMGYTARVAAAETHDGASAKGKLIVVSE